MARQLDQTISDAAARNRSVVETLESLVPESGAFHARNSAQQAD
jgi:hypothetical protein